MRTGIVMTDGVSSSMGRELPLRGAVNARDLGGLRTLDGRRVRRLRVLRSDLLTGLDAGDVAFLLTDCGLRTIVDLRAPGEIVTDGTGAVVDAVADYRNLHVYGADRVRLDLTEVALDGNMFDRYCEYLAHSSENIAAVLHLLAAPGQMPALIHCAAGKDRTGVVIALLLAVAGVRADDIIADYAATTPNIAALRARGGRAARPGADDRLPDWVFAADATTMRQFLTHLDTEYGGPGVWATRAGLDQATQQQLAENLLDDRGHRLPTPVR
ncbi:tyrosine-protein phosphatase [Nocardia sp. NPDC048505]|uniref:tyrosine-protein phosphatase n=1 Tax=Nocardia sp. NPDC048505 TaxID=3155756 RepID=UPI0033FDF306